jgi:Rrf2 family protein
MATNTRFATGMHTLVLLAREPNKLHSSETIAAKLQTNAVVIRRILAQLQQAGLVRNHKGPSGGSELVYSPAEISLADVYKAMEPGSQFNDAVMRGADAKTISTELRRVLTSAENALLASLQEVSLQQIVKNTTRKKA